MKFKNLRKILNLLFLIINLFLLSLLIFFISQNITGKAISNNFENQYTYAKAICNESNFCQDYQITCKNNEIKNIHPITGATIQKSTNWQDIREDRNLC